MEGLPVVRRQYHRVTEERIERLLQALSAGYTRTAACAIAGMSKSEFYRWIEEDGTDGTLSTLSVEPGALTNRERVEAAEAIAQARCEAIILTSARRNVQDAWAWLKRRAPDDWGARTERAENVNLNIDYNSLTDEQLERIAKGEDIGAVIGNPGKS